LIAVVLATTFSIRMPGLFVLKHIFYFGPAVFFLYRFWPAFFTYIAKFGPGLLFYCAMNMICGFDIESRHLGLLLPVIVCFAVSLWEKELAADKILWLLLIFSSLCFISIWFFPHLIFDGQERYHHYMWGIPNLNSMIILSILSIIFALRIRYIAGGCAKN
jgi:hypothetical protein